MKEDSELKKISEDEFYLVINRPDSKWYQEKGYSKQELKDNYELIDSQVTQLRHNLKKINDDIKKLNIKELSEEEKKFKALFKKMKSLESYDKLVVDKENIESQLSLFEDQLKEISLAVPEVKR